MRLTLLRRWITFSVTRHCLVHSSFNILKTSWSWFILFVIARTWTSLTEEMSFKSEKFRENLLLSCSLKTAHNLEFSFSYISVFASVFITKEKFSDSHTFFISLELSCCCWIRTSDFFYNNSCHFTSWSIFNFKWDESSFLVSLRCSTREIFHISFKF